MTEAEYRAIPDIHSGMLMDWFRGGPDYCLMEHGPKKVFEMGHIYETLTEDCSRGTEKFFEKFFVALVDAPMPAELAGWIEKFAHDHSAAIAAAHQGIGKPKYSPPGCSDWMEWCEAEKLFTRTKSSGYTELDKRFVSKHAWLDACGRHPEKFPISIGDYQKMERLLVSMRKIVPFEGYPDVTLGQLLDRESTEWQKELYWTDSEGNGHKALLDTLVHWNAELKVIIDFKWTGNLETFDGMFRKWKWLQGVFYRMGVMACFPGATVLPMIYAVAPFQEPYEATIRKLAATQTEAAKAELDRIISDVSNWIKNGKKRLGYLPGKSIRVFL